MSEFKEIVERHSSANYDLWHCVGRCSVGDDRYTSRWTKNCRHPDFQEYVENSVGSNQDLWKIIGNLLEDVNALQKKFKEIEEVETKSAQ